MRPTVMQSTDGVLGAGSRVSYSQSEIFCKLDIRNNPNWPAVTKRAKTHSAEILWQEDVHGDTPLHAAFRMRQDPPPEVILALQAASRVKNDAGNTPLHVAASHGCSFETLRVLLECASSHIKEFSPCADLNIVGRAPIHSACMSFRNMDMEAFMLLLDRTLQEGFITVDKSREPVLGFEDMDGDDELDDSYCTGEERHTIVVNVMSVKDSLGCTPLALLFGRYRQRVRKVISDIDASRIGNKDAPEHAALVSAMRVHRELGELWDKSRRIVTRLTEARLEHEGTAVDESFIQAASPAGEEELKQAAAWAFEQHRGSDPSEDDVLPVYVDVAERETSRSPLLHQPKNTRLHFRIVHASVGLIGYGCPPEMIRLAISIHPHQVCEMDEEGNLPLHIAVKASSFLGQNGDVASATAAAAAAVAAASFSDDASVLSEAASFFSSITVSQTTNPFDKVIKMLLQHFPEGARTAQGGSGQLPLVLAIQAGRRSWDDGIRTLLNAYPAALHKKKLIQPTLYPCVLALVTNVNEDDETALDRPRFLRSKKVRHDNHSRTTLFELLRAKPDWLTADGLDAS